MNLIFRSVFHNSFSINAIRVIVRWDCTLPWLEREVEAFFRRRRFTMGRGGKSHGLTLKPMRSLGLVVWIALRWAPISSLCGVEVSLWFLLPSFHPSAGEPGRLVPPRTRVFTLSSLSLYTDTLVYASWFVQVSHSQIWHWTWELLSKISSS